MIETFRTSLIKKDKETFLQLFLKDDITWTGVTTDGSIEMVANEPMPAEETFSNVRIDTDGEVAQVWFDYSFLDGSYRSNWGKESWQLARTEKGWKIAAVVWSQEINPVPPPKK